VQRKPPRPRCPAARASRRPGGRVPLSCRPRARLVRWSSVAEDDGRQSLSTLGGRRPAGIVCSAGSGACWAGCCSRRSPGGRCSNSASTVTAQARVPGARRKPRGPPHGQDARRAQEGERKPGFDLLHGCDLLRQSSRTFSSLPPPFSSTLAQLIDSREPSNSLYGSWTWLSR
jgi:hypothetical protein